MSFAQDLRASLLQAAMQGKLTEQLETDTPVCELLADIKAEKDKLIAEKKIKKEKPLSAISNDDIPFDIPENWEWVRCGQLLTVISGTSYDKTKITKDGITIARGGNLVNEIVIPQSDDVHLPIKDFYDKNKCLHRGDIVVVASTGSITGIGRPAFVDVDLVAEMQIGAFLRILRPVNNCLYDYLKQIFKSYYYRQHISKSVDGIGIRNLKEEHITNLLIPLPPIEEQKRIVRRIEEIMKHIDELEAIEEELKKLKEVFPADMKAAVLQAAMQGKLTEQLETDSSVDDLLEDIKKERAKLVAEGKIKKSRTKQNDNFVSLEDVPFDIPSSWKWVYLKSVAYTNGGYAFQSSQYSKEGIRVVRISDFNNDGLLFNQIVRHPFSKDLEQYIIKTNDILMCMTGGTVGKCCLINTIPEQMVTNQRVANISSILVQPQFLHYVLKSSVVQDIVKQNKNSTNDNISMDLILSFAIPLPPIEEQQRIVNKLETILPLIENI
ncbi:MAG: restriction endonuclease subunit S [Agathobacter sp.]|nr:restriction endonuclease subunit S [Agathobacter sp.]